MGRFINADAYASTGQGILGNNMFAYCLNNPIRYVDKSGTAAIDPICMVCMDFPGNGTGVRLQISYSQNARDIDDYLGSIINSKSIDELWSHKYVAVPVASVKVGTGLYHIFTGLGILAIPWPGLEDETIAMWKISWGFRSVIHGLDILGHQEGATYGENN
jgi:hypothetical protein